MHKSFKRSIAFLLAVVIFAVPVIAQAATFTDIENHWSKTYIEDMALRGIINGYTDNTVKPDANVTYAELLVMLSRMYGADDDMMDVIYKDYQKFLNTLFGSDYSWAHKSLAVCLDAGVISRTELENLYAAGLFGKPAVKENLAEYIVKGMGLGSMISNLGNYSLSNYKDASAISEMKKPYVYILSSKKIVEGDDAGKFNPQSSVSRAVTATMLSRAMNYMEANKLSATYKKYTSSAVVGTVSSSSLAGTVVKYTLKSTISGEKTVSIPTTAIVYIDNKASDYTAIKVGNYMQVRLDGDGNVLSVNVTSTPQTVSGSIVSIDAGKISVLNASTGSITRYYIDLYTEVKAGKSKGSNALITSDAGYQNATLVIDSESKKVKTLELSGGYYYTDGILSAIDNTSSVPYILIKDYSGVTQRIAVPTTVSITVNGLSNTLSESYLSCPVRLKISTDTDTLSSLAIDTSYQIMQGAFKSYISSSNPAKIYITDMSTNETKNFSVTDETIVSYEGKKVSLRELLTSDFITVKSANGVATQVYAYPGSQTIKGKISAIQFGDPIKLQIIDESSQISEFSFAASSIPSIKRGTAYTTIDKLYAGDEVTLDVRYNKVQLITAAVHSANTSGTIKKISLELSGNILTIIDNSGNEVSYPLASNARIIKGNSTVSLYDVQIGNKVALSVINGEVTSMEITETASATIELNGTLAITNASGVKSTITVNANSARLIKTNGNSFSLKDLVYGDSITIFGAYSGLTLAADIIIKK